MAFKLIIDASDKLVLSPYTDRALIIDPDDDIPLPCGPCCAPCPGFNFWYVKDYTDTMFGACEDCVEDGNEEWDGWMKSWFGTSPCNGDRNWGQRPAGASWGFYPSFDGGHKLYWAVVYLQQWNTTSSQWENIYEYVGDYPWGHWERRAPDGDCRWLFQVWCDGGSPLLVYEAERLDGRTPVGEFTDTGEGCGTGPSTVFICIADIAGMTLPVCMECPA